MKLVTYAVLLFAMNSGLHAAPAFSGSGINPLFKIQPEPGLTIRLMPKPNSDRLFWEVTQTQGTSTASTHAGEGVLPEETFVYHWEPGQRTFWFATPRLLNRITLVDFQTTHSQTSTTRSYQTIKDMPETFRSAIAALLEMSPPKK